MSASRTFSGKAAEPMVTDPGSAGSPVAGADVGPPACDVIGGWTGVVSPPPGLLELPEPPHAAMLSKPATARGRSGIRFIFLLRVDGTTSLGSRGLEFGEGGHPRPAGRVAAGDARRDHEALDDVEQPVDQHGEQGDHQAGG